MVQQQLNPRLSEHVTLVRGVRDRAQVRITQDIQRKCELDSCKFEAPQIEMEALLGGDCSLFERVDRLSEPYLIQVCEDMANGYQALQLMRVLYRDMKLENMMLT